jgi:hypothetical protein
MNPPQTPGDAPSGSRVRAIAFYLPQFHPIPENDEWWGTGFTEWTNVVRARPLFEGHDQPHLPTDLGFYDLRLPEVRAAQAELARAHGLHGFCYYYYSFGAKRLLERPLMDVLRSGQPDFPFCICWANESWSRRWDGAEGQVLVAQDDSDATYRGFIHEVLPFLLDRRYIRVNRAPVLLVWRAGRMPDAAGTTACWREAARAAGLPGLYLCAVQSHDSTIDPRAHGFDAAVEFPPSPWHGQRIDPKTLPGLDPDFNGLIMHVDSVQGDRPRGRVSLRSGEVLHLKGWSIAPGMESRRSASFLMLRSPNGDRIFTAPIPWRTQRHDVSFRHRNIDGRYTALAGFEVLVDSGVLTPGEYKLAVLHASTERVVAAFSEHRVVVQ